MHTRACGHYSIQFNVLVRIFSNIFLYFISSRAGGYTYHLDACKGVDCAGKCEDGTCVVSCAMEPWDQYVQVLTTED